MFKRLIYEDWLSLIPIASFFLTFGVFVFFFVRALRLEKKEANRLAHLPLSGGGDHQHASARNDSNSKKEDPSA